MKKIILLLQVLSFILVCHAEVINFDFFGTNNRGYYNSTTLNQDFQSEFGSTIKVKATILLESNSTENQQFIAQNKIIDHSPHGTFEELGTIVVVSLTDEEYKSGYHVSIGTAQRLFAKNQNNFRVTILSPLGKIIKRSDKVMNLQVITHAISAYKP